MLFVILKATMAAKGALSPKYYGYTKEEFRAMKKSGKTLAEIEARPRRRATRKKPQPTRPPAKEAAKHTTEALLEDIRNILAAQAKKD